MARKTTTTPRDWTAIAIFLPLAVLLSVILASLAYEGLQRAERYYQSEARV